MKKPPPSVDAKIFFMKMVLNPKNYCKILTREEKRVGRAIIDDIKELPELIKQIELLS